MGDLKHRIAAFGNGAGRQAAGALSAGEDHAHIIPLPVLRGPCRIVQGDAQDRRIRPEQSIRPQVPFEPLHQLSVAFAIPAGPAHIGDLQVFQLLNGQVTTSCMLIRVRPDSEMVNPIKIFCKNFFKMIDFSDFG